MPRKNKNHQKKLKLAIVAVLAVVLVGAGTFLVLAWQRNRQSEHNAADTSGDKNTAELYEQDDDQDSDRDKGADIKAQMDAEEEAKQEPAKNAAGKTIAQVFITYTDEVDGQMMAGAEVANIASGGGTCRYTFTSGGKTQVVETAALPSAKTTPCEAASAPKNGSGNWSVKVTYVSDTAEGESETASIETQ